MIIYPAIDIKDGKCVRLMQGNFELTTVYSNNPVDMALKWERLGAQHLHVIDLDGARIGKPENISIVGEMSEKLSIPLQLGGGIRTIETIEMVLSRGIQRIILGTGAVENTGLVEKALKMFGNSIVIGIDARDGMVAIEGWSKTSRFTAVDFAKKMEDLGTRTIIYTDISRDGMLTGPNLRAMEEMAKVINIEVIASGGVSKLQDIKDLKETGVSGAIIGKALYTGDVDLTEAIEAAKG
jgi:phosphoribosylformimino-5-aminoimidazole carboxamide ribotide isomerase